MINLNFERLTNRQLEETGKDLVLWTSILRNDFKRMTEAKGDRMENWVGVMRDYLMEMEDRGLPYDYDSETNKIIDKWEERVEMRNYGLD